MLTEILRIGSSALEVSRFLMEVKSIINHNTVVAQEIDHFIKSLNDNVDLLKKQPPKKGGSWAIAIERDLNEAAKELKNNLNNGNFMKFWDVKKTKDKLERLRQDLINKIQLNFQLAALEMTIDTNGKVDNFLPSMGELFSASSSQCRSETMASIRTIIQPLVVGMRRQDYKIEEINSIIRGNETKVETSMELDKFLQDVLASLDELTDKELDQYMDPFTMDVMTDPVKCFDGNTYDRFSVFHYNMTQRTPLVIACDDLDVRRRLFEKFDGVETKFRDLRRKYRDDALKHAKNGHSAEALSMLKNVLQWAPQDEECRKQIAKVEQEIAKYDSAMELVAQKVRSVAVDNVPEVQNNGSIRRLNLAPATTTGNEFSLRVVARKRHRGPQIHQDVRCDRCKMLPIEGPRFISCKRPKYDLCLKCFEASRKETSEIYTEVDRWFYRIGYPAYPEVHSGVMCDSCRMIPIAGPRFKSWKKANYDLCLKCFEASGATEQNSMRVLHPGIKCDECMIPIEGPRYISTSRFDYDLCHSCFEKNGNNASQHTRIDQLVVFLRSGNPHSYW